MASRAHLGTFWLLAVVVVMGVGCRRHDHAHGPAHSAHSHQHEAPHGGHLYELGDHQAQLEIRHDRAEGALVAYVLDGHAQHALRISAPTIELLIDRNGATETLLLRAVANPLSNETVGNTSEFRGEAEWLREAVMVAGRVKELTVRGATYREIPFVLW